MKKKNLTLLTFNAGLLKVELFNRRLVEPAPFMNERFDRLAASLLEVDADIIALQEIYKPKHQERLAYWLNERYPYHVARKSHWFQRLGSGLMFFSKHPILASAGHPFIAATPDEWWFVDKGMLSCTIDGGAFGQVNIANSHNTSGGLFWRPDRWFLDKIRQHQYRQMFRLLERYPSSQRIALGDFNAGPEACVDNYRELLSHGYADAWVTHHGATHSPPTWDSTNALNVGGPHRMTPPQRIDHVLLHDDLLRSTRVADARLVFEEPRVVLPNGQCVTLSDHYGLLVTLEKDV